MFLTYILMIIISLQNGHGYGRRVKHVCVSHKLMGYPSEFILSAHGDNRTLPYMSFSKAEVME